MVAAQGQGQPRVLELAKRSLAISIYDTKCVLTEKNPSTVLQAVACSDAPVPVDTAALRTYASQCFAK